jgi:ubiquinone/menaquinone biosynthesis C-methylase UbiE
MNFRAFLRRHLYTQNTIRYRVEWARLVEAWKRIPTPVDTLFDGGAGSGEYCRRLMQNGSVKQVKCIEFDDGNFARLKENLGSDPNATLIQGSVLEIPLPDQCVDVVMSTQVIEHILDHERVAAEFNRILKPGGHGIITVPHPPEPFPNEDHVREGYTDEDLSRLFAPHGWKPLWTDYFLVRDTVNAMMVADKFSRRRIPLLLPWVDKESHLDWAERKARLPFGILMLFQKTA